MPGALAPLFTSSPSKPIVRPLRPSDVAALHLPGERSNQAMREALDRYPGRSVWIPETLEFALLGAWRNRPEIANIDELVAVRHLEPLVQAAVERCTERGGELLLAIELEAGRRTSRFARAGLEMLEEVITYEIDVLDAPRNIEPGMSLARVAPNDAESISRITRLDHAAFPWLWRNSAAEFASYLRTPGVEAAFVLHDGVPVGYVGATLYTGWGHLDRIAVDPSRQGTGLGREALVLAIEGLRQRGARRVGLSTQRTNEISQRLYDRFGFERTPALDYQLFGAWCQTDLGREPALRKPVDPARVSSATGTR